ncbi:HalOD1 output domain-containing protein [Halogeometricum sp. CBA1124]|uniref:HalOD1 output domain-containing protein n=1 Tax=Halogeometricum sp. CBA1124 TaxID=2668071 RepID=UPI00142CF8EE|nr:HalOD1 output domain-containing protein [Halogeometricum sp. CBA1124]MUV58027.1 hypothetical protein [Halogeometricum sp. CBA1124]
MKEPSSDRTRPNDLTPDRDARWRQVVQRHFDPDGDEELTTALVFAIAEAEGVSPRDVKSPPLYEVIDATGVENALFGPGTGAETRRGVVEFHYDEYRLKIEGDGWILVFESADVDGP